MIDITQQRYRELLKAEADLKDYLYAVQFMTGYMAQQAELLAGTENPTTRALITGRIEAVTTFDDQVVNSFYRRLSSGLDD